MDNPNATRKLDEIVGRAIRDEKFRAKLVSDPKAVLDAEGLHEADIDRVLKVATHLSDEQLDGVSGGAGTTTTTIQPSKTLYTSFKTVFQQGSTVPNITIAAWSSDKACYERG
jgi:hypothetical protein